MVAIQLERARLDVRPVDELLGARRRQRQPRRAVEHPERPHRGDDALRPPDGAHGVGAHRMADGDVSLRREGRDRHGGDVDAEVLHEHHDGAADRPGQHIPIYKRLFHWALYLESMHTPNYTQRVNTDNTYLSIRVCFTGHCT